MSITFIPSSFPSFSHQLAVRRAAFISESKQLPVPIALRQLTPKRSCPGISGRDRRLGDLTINCADYRAGLPGSNNSHQVCGHQTTHLLAQLEYVILFAG